MHRRLITLQYLPLLLTVGVVLPSEGMQPDGDSSTARTVWPGVVHCVIHNEEGPWVIHVLQVNLTQNDLRLTAVKALDRVKGRETTSAMARRSPDSLSIALAAINGDFFSPDGEPVGQEVNDATIVRARSPHDGVARSGRSHFGLTADGRPFISRVMFSGLVVFRDGSARRIARINGGWDQSACSLFNAYFGESTPPDTLPPLRREWALVAAGTRDDTALYVVPDSVWTRGGTPVPPGGIVLSEADSAAASPVARGDTVRILLGFTPAQGRVQTLVGGGPRIVLDGRNVAGTEEHREGTAPDFSSRRHPRSGIGFSADTTMLFFVTVDGRQDSSAGMSLQEFAELMVSFGIAQGMNLDGGGSTTMVVEGNVVNSPSDAAGERPVANCLVLLGRKKVY